MSTIHAHRSGEGLPETYEDLLREVFSRSLEGFQVIDRDWRYLYVNNEVAKQGKSTPEELIGHTMQEKYPGIEQTPVYIQMKRVMDEGISIRMENEFSFPDGSRGWFLLFIHPCPGGIYIFSVDISDRKRMEQALLSKIETMTKVFATAPSDRTLFEDLHAAVRALYRQEPTEI